MSDINNNKTIDKGPAKPPGFGPVEGVEVSERNLNTFGGLKMAHLSDIYIRADMHEEYQIVFENLYTSLIKKKPDIIIITGNLFYNKKHAAPIEIAAVKDFLHNLQSIAPTIVIPGNHDTIVHKPGSLDLITPIIKNSDNLPNLYYFRNTGHYKIPNFNKINFLVSAPDGPIFPKQYPIVFKSEDLENELIRRPGEIYISLANEELMTKRFDNSKLHIDDFANIDLVLFGNSPNQEFLNNRASYSGSLIQQSIMEPYNGHGYILWTCEKIENDNLLKLSSEKVGVYNPSGFLKISYKQNTDITELPIPINVKAATVEYTDCTREFLEEQLEIIKKKYNIKIINCLDEKPKVEKPANEICSINDDLGNLNIQEESIKEILKNTPIKGAYFTNSAIETVLELHRDKTRTINKKLLNKTRWRIKKLKFNNMFCYGPNNIIDFSKIENVISGIIAPNATGKTSFIDIITYVLFNDFNKDLKLENVLNNTFIKNGYKPTSFDIRIDLEIDNTPAYIRKRGHINKNANNETLSSTITTNVSFFLNDKDISGKDTTETYKIISDYIGTYHNAKQTGFVLYKIENDFMGEKSTERKKILSKLFDLSIFEDIIKDIKTCKKSCEDSIIGINKMYVNMTRNTEPDELDKLRIRKKQLAAQIQNDKEDINEYQRELKLLNSIYRSKTQVAPELVEVSEAELIEYKSIENIETPPTIKIETVPKPEQPKPADPKIAPNSQLLMKLKALNGEPKKFKEISREKIAELLASLGENSSPEELYYKNIYNISDEEFKNIKSTIANLGNEDSNKNPSLIKIAEIDELKSLQFKKLSNIPAESSIQPNPKLLNLLIHHIGESNKNPGLRPVEHLGGVRDDPRQDVRGSKPTRDIPKNTIIQYLKKFDITSDPDTLNYKDVCLYKDYDKDKHEELRKNKIDTTNHKLILDSLNKFATNQLIPAEINKAIEKYNQLNKKIIVPFNLSDLELAEQCKGCANTRRVFADAKHKENIMQQLNEINTYKNKISAELKSAEMLHLYNKMYVAQLLVEYQSNIIYKLQQAQQTEDYKLYLRKQELEAKAAYTKNYKIYVAYSLLQYQNNLALSLQNAQLYNDWTKYEIFKEAYDKAAKQQAEIDKNQIAAIKRREFLQYKIASRAQIIEDNLTDFNADLLKNEIEFAKLSGEETRLEETIANINNLKLQMEQEQNKILIYDGYLTVLDGTKGMPNLLLRRNYEILQNAINDTLATYTEMQIIMSEDSNIKVKRSNIDIQPLEACSGYQLFILSMAYRIAITKFSNAPLFDGIIIDEGLGSTDSANMQYVLEFLRKLAKQYYTLMVITHNEVLQNAIEKPLYIERIDNYSLIKNTDEKIEKSHFAEYTDDNENPNKYYCLLCKMSIIKSSWQKHAITDKHLAKKNLINF